MTEHLIAGLGEVGQGLQAVLQPFYPTITPLDRKKGIIPTQFKFDVIHVCFPYTDDFHKAIEVLRSSYQPELIIIHSTVPVGTTAPFESFAVHSPIRGVHPTMAQGIRVFTKHFGGPRAEEAAALFQKAAIKTRCHKDSRVTEALKLWDTTQYGWMIILEKLMHRWCENEFGGDAAEVMDVIYREANAEYNRTYSGIGRPEVVRPFLNHMEGPIGGHCVVPNTDLLGDSDIPTIIRYVNSQLEKREG